VVLAAADADHRAISGRLAGVNGQVVDEFMATGAVVAGRETFEPAGASAATAGRRVVTTGARRRQEWWTREFGPSSQVSRT
jgi:hypothetical protein